MPDEKKVCEYPSITSEMFQQHVNKQLEHHDKFWTDEEIARRKEEERKLLKASNESEYSLKSKAAALGFPESFLSPEGKTPLSESTKAALAIIKKENDLFKELLDEAAKNAGAKTPLKDTLKKLEEGPCALPDKTKLFVPTFIKVSETPVEGIEEYDPLEDDRDPAKETNENLRKLLREKAARVPGKQYRLWRDVPYEELCRALNLPKDGEVPFKTLYNLVQYHNRVFPVKLSFLITSVEYDEALLLRCMSNSPYNVTSAKSLVPVFRFDSIVGALEYPGPLFSTGPHACAGISDDHVVVTVGPTQCISFAPTAGPGAIGFFGPPKAPEGPVGCCCCTGPTGPEGRHRTETFRLRFSNGEEVECPEPGEGWECVRTDTFEWPSRNVNGIHYCCGEFYTIKTLAANGRKKEIEVTEKKALCWLGDYGDRALEDLAQVLWRKVWEKDREKEEEPETYVKSPYEFL